MTQLEESVLGAGFVAMTEEELYAVNGGRGRSGNSSSSSGKSTPTSTPIAVPSGAGQSGGSGKNGGNTSESGGKNGGGKGTPPTVQGYQGTNIHGTSIQTITIKCPIGKR